MRGMRGMRWGTLERVPQTPQNFPEFLSKTGVIDSDFYSVQTIQE